MEKMKSFRYKMELPPIENLSNFKVKCSIESVDWETLSWLRFGSGGHSNARHCFVDDWRLEHLWRRPGQGLAKAICTGILTAPDFSIETYFPQEIALYQVYRSNLLAYYWQSHGVKTIPVLQWGNESTFWLSRKYIAFNSVVAVRGPGKGNAELKRWIAGAEFMQEFCKPFLVLHFGREVKNIWDNALFFPLNPRSKNSLAG